MCIRDRTLNDQEGSRLLKLQKIGDIDAEVIRYTTLNTINRARVRRDLLNCTEEEITAEQAPQGVIAC